MYPIIKSDRGDWCKYARRLLQALQAYKMAKMNMRCRTRRLIFGYPQPQLNDLEFWLPRFWTEPGVQHKCTKYNLDIGQCPKSAIEGTHLHRNGRSTQERTGLPAFCSMVHVQPILSRPDGGNCGFGMLRRLRVKGGMKKKTPLYSANCTLLDGAVAYASPISRDLAYGHMFEIGI